jgi:hypothetical protein
MIVLVSAIVVTGVILLIYALLSRSTTSEALQGEVQQRLEDENHRRVDEPPLPSAEADWRLTQQPALRETDRSRCPACAAIITANDERCPSCDITFVADGSPKWTPGTVGPADGIYLPPTEVSE